MQIITFLIFIIFYKFSCPFRMILDQILIKVLNIEYFMFFFENFKTIVPRFIIKKFVF